VRRFLPFIPIVFFSPVALKAQPLQAKIESLDEVRAAKVVFLNPEYLAHHPDLADAKAKLPLVIYLHGAGGVGDDTKKNTARVRAVVKGVRRFRKGPCLIVAPQCRRASPKPDERGVWIPEDLNLFLEHLLETYTYLDPNRVYLTGNSMGGYGCWVWGGHSPNHFAAIAPIVGGIGRGGPKDVTPDLEKWATKLARVPVYAFAGARDKVVPADRSERMIASIRKAGGEEAQLLVYPEEGHGASRRVYTSKTFFDWMFSQKRKSGLSRIKHRGTEDTEGREKKGDDKE